MNKVGIGILWMFRNGCIFLVMSSGRKVILNVDEEVQKIWGMWRYILGEWGWLAICFGLVRVCRGVLGGHFCGLRRVVCFVRVGVYGHGHGIGKGILGVVGIGGNFLWVGLDRRGLFWIEGGGCGWLGWSPVLV